MGRSWDFLVKFEKDHADWVIVFVVFGPIVYACIMGAALAGCPQDHAVLAPRAVVVTMLVAFVGVILVVIICNWKRITSRIGAIFNWVDWETVGGLCLILVIIAACSTLAMLVHKEGKKDYRIGNKIEHTCEVAYQKQITKQPVTAPASAPTPKQTIAPKQIIEYTPVPPPRPTNKHDVLICSAKIAGIVSVAIMAGILYMFHMYYGNPRRRRK